MSSSERLWIHVPAGKRNALTFPGSTDVGSVSTRPQTALVVAAVVPPEVEAMEAEAEADTVEDTVEDKVRCPQSDALKSY